MSDAELQDKMNQLLELDEQVAELYQAVEIFLNNFGKDSALYPTRSYVQVNAAELQKLAKIFYQQIS